MIRRVIIGIIFLFLLTSLIRNGAEYQKSSKTYQIYRDEYEHEAKKKIELQTKKIKESDPNEIEKTIRNKLSMVKKGEIVLIIPIPTSTPPSIPTPTLPTYQQWIRLLLHN